MAASKGLVTVVELGATDLLGLFFPLATALLTLLSGVKSPVRTHEPLKSQRPSTFTIQSHNI
jgi:hypothetical protein